MQWEQAERQINLLKRQLQNTKQSKNHQIQELEHALDKANIRINELQRLSRHQEHECNSLKEQYKGLQAFSKERSLSLTQKNIQIANFQKQLEDLSARKAQESQAITHKLLEVIREQQIELNLLLADHQNYLAQLEKISIPFAQLRSECGLLTQYSTQLEKQVKQVQSVNIGLQSWVSQAHHELSLQNQQSNDLIGEMEYIVGEAGPTAVVF